MVRFYLLLLTYVSSLAWANPAPAAKNWTIIHEQDTSASEIQMQWVVRSGSLSDPLDKPGLAHFTARALLRGTTTRPFPDLTQAFQSISATVIVDTQHEFTRFLFRFPANRLDPFLHLIRDVFTNPEFDPLEVNRLRAELIAEAQAQTRDSKALVAQVAMRELYSGSSAQAATYGEVAGLSRISAVDIRQFFRQHYGVSNLVLAIAAPQDEQTIQSKISQTLSVVPDAVSQPVFMPAPTARGISGVVISDSQAFDIPFQIVLPGVPASDSERIGLELANRTFGIGPDSRLAQCAPNLNGWLTWASSGFDQTIGVSRGAGPYSIIGTATPDYVSDVVPATVELFRWFVQDGLTEQEFRKARDETLASASTSMNSAYKRMIHRLNAFLSDRAVLDLPGWQAELARWSAKSVSLSMKSRMLPDPAVVVLLGDPSQLVPVLQAIPGMGPVRTISR